MRNDEYCSVSLHAILLIKISLNIRLIKFTLFSNETHHIQPIRTSAQANSAYKLDYTLKLYGQQNSWSTLVYDSTTVSKVFTIISRSSNIFEGSM
jgi:hypothetical protein